MPFLSVQSISENNQIVVIDAFFTVRRNKNYFVIIFNSGSEIKKNCNLNIQDSYANNKRLQFVNRNISKTFDGANMIEEFQKGFHHDVMFAEIEFSNEVFLQIDKKSYKLNFAEPCLDFLKSNVMTTIFRNEHDFLERWVSYYQKIKFDYFIVQDNSDIINFDFQSKLFLRFPNVYVIHAPWKQWQSSWTNNRSSVGQVIQQNHCLWKFPCKLMGFLDLDEFLHPNVNIEDDFKSSSVSVVSYDSFWFGCGSKKQNKYSYRKKESQKYSNRKIIVRSDNVDLVCVHVPANVVNGMIIYSEQYFAHYHGQSSKNRTCQCEIFCQVYDPAVQVFAGWND